MTVAVGTTVVVSKLNTMGIVLGPHKEKKDCLDIRLWDKSINDYKNFPVHPSNVMLMEGVENDNSLHMEDKLFIIAAETAAIDASLVVGDKEWFLEVMGAKAPQKPFKEGVE